MSLDKGILVGHKVVPCEDTLQWAKHFESQDRIVRQDYLDDPKTGADVKVSTVFLGINHQLFEGPPQWFETMIFGGLHNDYQERYETWDQAERGHQRAIDLVLSLDGSKQNKGDLYESG